jgi:hypothetical protein
MNVSKTSVCKIIALLALILALAALPEWVMRTLAPVLLV